MFHQVKTLELLVAVGRAVEVGLAAAAVVDRFGTALAVAGALTEDEVRQILGPLINRIAREAVRTRRTTIVG
jgi:hypothetical protein